MESSDNNTHCEKNKVDIDDYEMGEHSGVTAFHEESGMSDNESDDSVSSTLAQLQNTWNGSTKNIKKL